MGSKAPLSAVQLHVLIVGAGIAGLAAAVAFRIAGHKVQVSFSFSYLIYGSGVQEVVRFSNAQTSPMKSAPPSPLVQMVPGSCRS
jgi:hypothetical protein